MDACRACGAAADPDHKFCHECGARLVDRGERDGEYRRITALFCDMVGSTAHAERLGAEAVHELLDRFLTIGSDAVSSHGGRVHKFMGDGFLAVFGFPLAAEDHARRAVLTALTFREAVEAEWPGVGGAVRARIGVASGTALVGRVGSGADFDVTAIGDAPNLASRLESMAESGQILVSGSTAELVRGYVGLEDAGELPVRGLDDRVRAFRVTGRGDRRDRLDDPGRRVSSFVGRRRQLGALGDLLDEAREARGQVVGVVGEPGMGKTRLIAEFRRGHEGSATFLEGRCVSYGADTPLGPFADLLRQWLGPASGTQSDDEPSRLRDLLADRGCDAELWSYAGTVLGLTAAADALANRSPQAIRDGVFSTLRELLLAEAARRPCVVVIEDLHWIDSTSEELLSTLVDELPGAAMMLVATYRPGYDAPWNQRSYATQLALPRLTSDESLALARSLSPGYELSKAVVDAIDRAAEGNPFYVEELSQAVVGDDALAAPDSVHDVLSARIDSLSREARSLLGLIAVVGRECPLEVLGCLSGDQASSATALDDLKANEFVFVAGHGGRSSVVLKHALTQDVAYSRLRSDTRRDLHARVARAVEAAHEGRVEEVSETLGHHYAEAGLPDEAVTYLLMSAERWLAGYANASAAATLERALEVIGDSDAPDASSTALRVLFRLAHAVHLLGDFRRGRELLDEHEPRLDRVDDRGRSAAEFAFWRSFFATHLGLSESADLHARTAIRRARSAGDSGTEGRAYYVLSREDFWLCRFHEGVENGRLACERLEKAGDWWWLGHAASWKGVGHYGLGEFDEARAGARRMHAIGSEWGDPRLESYGDWLTGCIEASRGNWEAGIDFSERGRARSPDHLNTTFSIGWLGFAHLQRGDFEEASGLLETAIGLLREIRYSRLIAWFGSMLGEAYLGAGRPTEARTTILDAQRLAEEVAYPWALAVTTRAQGRMLVGEGDAEAGRGRLHEALRRWESIGALFEAAVTRLDLAGVDTAQREGHLRRAHAAFEHSNSPWYSARAREVADELGLPLATGRAGSRRA